VVWNSIIALFSDVNLFLPAQSGETPIRQQVNAITSFIDASNVYGSSLEQQKGLRDGGKNKICKAMSITCSLRWVRTFTTNVKLLYTVAIFLEFIYAYIESMYKSNAIGLVEYAKLFVRESTKVEEVCLNIIAQ
jgi:hypothetical protein